MPIWLPRLQSCLPLAARTRTMRLSRRSLTTGSLAARCLRRWRRRRLCRLKLLRRHRFSMFLLRRLSLLCMAPPERRSQSRVQRAIASTTRCARMSSGSTSSSRQTLMRCLHSRRRQITLRMRRCVGGCAMFPHLCEMASTVVSAATTQSISVSAWARGPTFTRSTRSATCVCWSTTRAGCAFAATPTAARRTFLCESRRRASATGRKTLATATREEEPPSENRNAKNVWRRHQREACVNAEDRRAHGALQECVCRRCSTVAISRFDRVVPFVSLFQRCARSASGASRT
jgi:hypothetical protein